MPRENIEIMRAVEIDLLEVFEALRLNNKFILLLTGIIAVLSIIFALTLPNVYKSQALLAPTSMNVNSKLSQYDAIASVTGFNLGESSPDVTLALAFINSKKIIRQLMKHESFLPDLMAAKKWDIESNSIIYDDDLYDNKDKKWVREVKFPLQQVPSEQEVFELFSEKIKIFINKDNQLITLSVDHLSPSVAKQWVDWILEEANMMVANLRIEEAESSINYLNEQIKLTPYAELRTMFFDLIQKNTQNMMLAKVNKQYALTIIDPPLVPETKFRPQRLLIFILGILMGSILSLSIILVRRFGFNKEDELNIFKLYKGINGN
jgi:uncharacterized protein involved in exopolysaccharide biosynthesis